MFKFENRSRTTCSRFLRSFASPLDIQSTARESHCANTISNHRGRRHTKNRHPRARPHPDLPRNTLTLSPLRQPQHNSVLNSREGDQRHNSASFKFGAGRVPSSIFLYGAISSWENLFQHIAAKKLSHLSLPSVRCLSSSARRTYSRMVSWHWSCGPFSCA